MKLKPLLYGSLKHSKSLFAIAFRLWWEPRQKRGFFLRALRSLLWLPKFLTKAVAKEGCRPPKPSLTAEVLTKAVAKEGCRPNPNEISLQPIKCIRIRTSNCSLSTALCLFFAALVFHRTNFHTTRVRLFTASPHHAQTNPWRAFRFYPWPMPARRFSLHNRFENLIRLNDGNSYGWSCESS